MVGASGTVATQSALSLPLQALGLKYNMLSDAKGAGSHNTGLKKCLHHLFGGRTRSARAEYTNHLNTCLELRRKLSFKMSKRVLELGKRWVADDKVGPSLGMGAKIFAKAA